MKVRYNPVIGIVVLVVGAASEFLGLWLYLLGQFNTSVVVGAILLLLGILYLVRPYFWVYPTTVEVTALVGPVRRKFPFETLRVEGNRMFADADTGVSKKVPVTRWMAHSADWTAVTRGR
jgi:hypothetical protein